MSYDMQPWSGPTFEAEWRLHPHMAEVWLNGRGLVCFEHDYALPALVLTVSSVASVKRHSGSGVAQDNSLHNPFDLSDSSFNQPFFYGLCPRGWLKFCCDLGLCIFLRLLHPHFTSSRWSWRLFPLSDAGNGSDV